MQENICLLMERPNCASTALLVRSARMVHRRVKSVKTGSTQMQPPKLLVVFLVAKESTVKCRELGKLTARASRVQKARTRLPKAWIIWMDATSAVLESTAKF